MTRTSLHELATAADVWLVKVPGSSELELGDGETLRFGEHAPANDVAAVILRHQLETECGRVDESLLAEELERHGYAGSRPHLATTSAPRPRRRAVGS